MDWWVWLILVAPPAALVTCLVCRRHAVLLWLAAIAAVATVPVGLRILLLPASPEDMPQDFRMGMSVIVLALKLGPVLLLLVTDAILLAGGLIRRASAARRERPAPGRPHRGSRRARDL
jgi:hypothetical protein